jgi:glycosyltransferase involved in cell wall biosynthesis
MMQNLSIIYAMYNEEKRLENTILDIKKFNEKTKHLKKINFVDDASTDKTNFIINNFIK